MARSTWWNPDLVATAKQCAPGRRWWLWLAIAYGPMFVWLCWPLTGLGGWSTAGIEFFVFVPILGFGLWLVALPLAMGAKSRERARRLFLGGAVLLLGFLPLLLVGHRVRMLAFDLAGERAAPLVAAIEQRIVAIGAPPRALADLVPDWLAQLPDGLPALEVVIPGYDGNGWMLRASVPSGILNFDEFVYLPNQNYPTHDWGGWVQRLGRWGYLHE